MTLLRYFFTFAIWPLSWVEALDPLVDDCRGHPYCRQSRYSGAPTLRPAQKSDECSYADPDPRIVGSVREFPKRLIEIDSASVSYRRIDR